MLRACYTDMPHVRRQRRQKSAGILISLVAQGHAKDRKRVTQVVQAQRSAATPRWNPSIEERLTKRLAQRIDRIEPTRRRWKERGIRITVAKMIIDLAPAVLQAGDKVGRDRHQSGLSEFRIIHTQNAGREIDVAIGEMEDLAGAKSRQVKHDEGCPEDGTTDGRTVTTGKTSTSLKETAAFSTCEDTGNKSTPMNAEKASPGNVFANLRGRGSDRTHELKSADVLSWIRIRFLDGQQTRERQCW